MSLPQVSASLILMSLALSAGNVIAQSNATSWSGTVQNEFQVIPDLTYLTASNKELKVDVYRPRNADGPVPTFIYYHGGGWVAGSKEANVLRLLPFLERGWAAVNVQYRLAEVSEAPAAVEDSLCALRWVAANANEFGFDTSRLVVSGNSAGGHLALTTGMLGGESGLGLDRQCPGDETPAVAAIVNWYGITDVGDLLDGVNRKSYAVRWLGSRPDRFDIAARVSPLNHVRPALPPIITVHGDADPTVPYAHAIKLHQALDRNEVINQLVTVPAGRHGGFPDDQMLRIYREIFSFLDTNVSR